MSSTAFTVDTTGEVVAFGVRGQMPTPNRVKIDTAGDILVGQSADDAVFPIAAADDQQEFTLVGSDQLYVKAASGTVAITVHESLEYERPDAIDGKAVAYSAGDTGGFWFDASRVTELGQQELANNVFNVEGAKLQNGSSTSEDSNSAVFLPHDGRHYARMYENTGNDISAVDASTDVTGDSVFEFIGSLYDFSTNRNIVRKLTVSAGWAITTNASGAPVFTFRDGGAARTHTSTVPIAGLFAPGEVFGLRFEFIADNGDSGTTGVWQYSKDRGDTWRHLDTSIVAGVATIDSQTTVSMGILCDSFGNSPADGTLEALRIYSAGSLVLDLDLSRDIDTSSDPDAGQTSITPRVGDVAFSVGRATSGLTTTIVTRPVILFDGTDDYLQLPSTSTPTYTATDGKLTVVVLFREQAVQLNGRLWSNEAASGGFGSTLYVTTGGTVAAFNRGVDGTTFTTARSVTLGDLSVVAMIVDEGELYSYSTSGGMSASSDLTDDGVIAHGAPRAGTTLGTASPYMGEIFAVLHYPDKALSLAELTALDSYLRTGA